MELVDLRQVVAERAAGWEAAGAVFLVTNGPPTDKPAAWLDLTTVTQSGRLIVWTSGEAEMEWGTTHVDGQRHCDLADDSQALRACIDDLESAVGLR